MRALEITKWHVETECFVNNTRPQDVTEYDKKGLELIKFWENLTNK